MLERLKQAIDAIGSDVVTRDKQRAADLGLRVDKDGNFNGFVSFNFTSFQHVF